MVLHGWKQIAQYLGCGIRTAQRWESQCGLPVTRPRNHLRSPVLAQSEALDSWAGGVPRSAAEQWENRFVHLQEEIDTLKHQVALLASGASADAAAERNRGDPVAGGQRVVPAKAPRFDA